MKRTAGHGGDDSVAFILRHPVGKVDPLNVSVVVQQGEGGDQQPEIRLEFLGFQGEPSRGVDVLVLADMFTPVIILLHVNCEKRASSVSLLLLLLLLRLSGPFFSCTAHLKALNKSIWPVILPAPCTVEGPDGYRP